jgi:hypothetical protein
MTKLDRANKETCPLERTFLTIGAPGVQPGLLPHLIRHSNFAPNFGTSTMLVTRLEVPPDTRLAFQPDNGPLTHINAFHDLGVVRLAEQHADESLTEDEPLESHRMVLECEGVEASRLIQALNWPRGETALPGTVKFGQQTYPATLQVRARPHGLSATLRSTR